MSKTTKEDRDRMRYIYGDIMLQREDCRVVMALDDLEAAEAEVQRLREQTQWRPIETCDVSKLNLEKVILWCESGAEVGTWFKHFGCWSDGRTELRKVTHWMPIKPPQESESE